MINIKNWVYQQISHPDRIALPIMTHPGIELIGQTVKEAVQENAIHARAVKMLSDGYPTGM
jgi:uroporphyrinogen decarboxylase